MANRLIVAVLLAFACGKLAAQTHHSLQWDRFWLAANLSSYTLNVRLGDSIQFSCRVEETESREDKHENVVLLTEEKHLNDCDVGTGTSQFITECPATGIDFIVQILDLPSRINVPSFKAGETYYFTSFSNGTLDSAQKDKNQGGACASDPPLRLTVNVAATSSSSIVSSSTISEVITITTSSVMDKIVPTSSKSISPPPPLSTSTTIPTPPTTIITRTEELSGTGLLSPAYSVILLLLFITHFLFYD